MVLLRMLRGAQAGQPSPLARLVAVLILIGDRLGLYKGMAETRARI